MSTRAVIYARQSQALNDDRAAVERQREACVRLAEERGLDVVGEYEDNDYSATSGRPRPAYTRMVEDYQRGSFDAIVAFDLDRLYRIPRELEDLIDMAEQRGLQLHTVGGDADLRTDGGRLFARIKAAVAKGEIERKTARQRARNEQDRAKGRPYWRRRPFGYTTKAEQVPEEVEALRWAYDAILSGESNISVANELNRRGITTAHGSQWRGNSIARVLESPRNAGLMEWDGELVRGAWEPVIDEARWRQARALYESRRRGANPPNRRSYLLTTLATCTRCEEEGVRTTVRSGSSKGTRVYRCYRKYHLARVAQRCDDIVNEFMVTYLSRPDVAEALREDEPESAAALDERNALRGRLEMLDHDHYVEGILPRPAYLETRKALQARLRSLEGQIAVSERSSVLSELITTDRVGEVWDGLSVERRREAVRAVAEVRLMPGQGVPIEIRPLQDGAEPVDGA